MTSQQSSLSYVSYVIVTLEKTLDWSLCHVDMLYIIKKYIVELQKRDYIRRIICT